MAATLLQPSTEDANDRAAPPPEPAVDEERLAFERNFDRSSIAVSWRELLAGFVALAAWFLLFAGGILIATAPYIKTLGTNVAIAQWTSAMSMIVLFWTITNVGILSCLAAVLGAFGRRTRFTSRLAVNYPDDTATNPTNADPRIVVIMYATAIIRGFGVYALMLAGLLVMATETMLNPSQDQYVRLAATISVISFYAGYDPEMFAGILERIKRLVESKPSGAARD
jgi:hypothetical protein